MTCAVPSVGWPAKGISASGVKIRTRYGGASDSTYVVSEKPISAANACMSAAETAS